jgi:ferredoxin
MGDREQRYGDNVPGRWYVDRKCILCSVCSEAAPKNFKEADSNDHDICFKQPEGEEEIRQCEEAMAACPVEAIGNDAEG